MQREFGPKKYNRTPIKGYDVQPRFNTHNTQYVNPGQQGLQWARKERKDYDAAYGEFEKPHSSVAVMEREPVGNKELPIIAHKEQIVESVNNNQLTIRGIL